MIPNMEETVAEAVEESRRGMRGWLGTVPATVRSIEQVQTMEGHQVLVVLDTAEGPRAFALDPRDAAGASRRLHEVAGSASTGLFVVGGTG